MEWMGAGCPDVRVHGAGHGVIVGQQLRSTRFRYVAILVLAADWGLSSHCALRITTLLGCEDPVCVCVCVAGVYGTS